MNATERTIQLLRELTMDGILTGEEVWTLAKFLNEDRECANCWPGNVLVPMLSDAFADAELTELELACLAQAISSIEREQAALAGPGGLAEPGERSVPVFAGNCPRLPGLDLRVTVPSATEEFHYEVDLQNHSCTCNEWTSRNHWPVGHPGRCCMHVAKAFAEHASVLHPCLAAIIEDCVSRKAGTDPQEDWLMADLETDKPVAISGGPNPWHKVFASSWMGYGRYGFNRLQKRWSYGAAPKDSVQIESVITSKW